MYVPPFFFSLRGNEFGHAKASKSWSLDSKPHSGELTSGMVCSASYNSEGGAGAGASGGRPAIGEGQGVGGRWAVGGQGGLARRRSGR